MDVKKAGLVVVIGGVLIAVATQLAAFTFDLGLGTTETLKYFDTDDGKLVAGLGVIILLFGAVLAGGKARKSMSILALIFSLLTLATVYIDFSDAEGPIKAGMGLYLSMLGAVLGAVGGIMGLMSKGAATSVPPMAGIGGGAMPPPGPGLQPPGGMPPPTGGMPPGGGMPPASTPPPGPQSQPGGPPAPPS